MTWYYAEGSTRNGPVEEEALRELVRTGVVRDSTLVWREGMSQWAPFADVRAQLDPAATPPPMPPPVLPSGDAAPAATNFCTNCGRAAAPHEIVAVGGRMVCAYCKPVVLQQIREGSSTLAGREYGGFWIRVVAILIDTVILSMINVGVMSALSVGFAISFDPEKALAGALGSILLLYLLSTVLHFAYEVWFTANRGATPGKMVLGLRVVRAQGGPLGYGLATGRYFGKMVSGFLLGIGFLMAGWDPEKRALHDRLCDTRIIKVR